MRIPGGRTLSEAETRSISTDRDTPPEKMLEGVLVCEKA